MRVGEKAGGRRIQEGGRCGVLQKGRDEGRKSSPGGRALQRQEGHRALGGSAPLKGFGSRKRAREAGRPQPSTASVVRQARSASGLRQT